MDRGRLNIDTLASALARPAPGPTSDYDLNPHIRQTLPPGRRLRAAAVLIPLIERGAGLSVVLTRRSVRLKHHPGQVAFPGGKIEDGDDGPVGAALREAEEEIGLPAATVSPLGTMDPHETVTGFTVTPVLARAAPFDPVPDPGEVAEVFEVPLAFLLDPANHIVEGRDWRGQRRQYYVMPYGRYYIWGATARIIKALADRVNAT